MAKHQEQKFKSSSPALRVNDQQTITNTSPISPASYHSTTSMVEEFEMNTAVKEVNLLLSGS